MALARGKFGIEYNPKQMERNPIGFGWVFAVVALAALVSFTWTLVGRFRSGSREAEAKELTQAGITPVVLAPEEPAVSAELPQVVTNAVPPPPPLPTVVPPQETLLGRPAKVRNLLMRLEEAEKTGDVEMAVSTIETIRQLPGSPAADLDDKLARRLGELNTRRLFEIKSAQWVARVTVKRGDSASRIASEHGSTLASLARLNGGNVDRVVLGRTLYVLEHPRFNLVIHRRQRTAELSLNGKFFKRYDLRGEVKAKVGAYETSSRMKSFWSETGIQLKTNDRTELETLLPSGTSVIVSEM